MNEHTGGRLKRLADQGKKVGADETAALASHKMIVQERPAAVRRAPISSQDQAHPGLGEHFERDSEPVPIRFKEGSYRDRTGHPPAHGYPSLATAFNREPYWG